MLLGMLRLVRIVSCMGIPKGADVVVGLWTIYIFSRFFYRQHSLTYAPTAALGDLSCLKLSLQCQHRFFANLHTSLLQIIMSTKADTSAKPPPTTRHPPCCLLNRCLLPATSLLTSPTPNSRWSTVWCPVVLSQLWDGLLYVPNPWFFWRYFVIASWSQRMPASKTCSVPTVRVRVALDSMSGQANHTLLLRCW